MSISFKNFKDSIIKSFKTAKGSHYDVYGTTTIRNKSYHPEHGEKDVGIQPQSDITVYVKPDHANHFGSIFQGVQALDRRIILDHKTNKVTTVWHDGTKWNINRDAIYDYQSHPKIGMVPLELWNKVDDKGYKIAHFGNNITEVN